MVGFCLPARRSASLAIKHLFFYYFLYPSEFRKSDGTEKYVLFEIWRDSNFDLLHKTSFSN